jgi:predicted RNase H-like HicB family nuclease
MKSRSFTVVLYKEDDMYIAECPEVGTVDQGETIEQAIAGLREATRLYLEEFPLPETSPRFVTSIELTCPQADRRLSDCGISATIVSVWEPSSLSWRNA